MKKLTPYIFPLVVILIVFFLVYRWFVIRTEKGIDPSSMNEGIQIEDLSSEKASSLLRGSNDLESTPLTPDDATAQEDVVGTGTIRYEVVEGKVNFSVIADLPENETGYQVWIRTQDKDNLTLATQLEAAKGGYMSTISVAEDQLPLEVMVTTAKDKSRVLDTVILRGMIKAEQAEESTQVEQE